MSTNQINTFLKRYRDKIGSSSIEESRYGEVTNWISTGSPALNRIISGSIKKGIPSGRVIVLAGESAVGKSLIAATIIANAQKAGCDHVFYFDSEGGGTKEFFKNAGCNTELIEQILVESIEDCQLKILETYNLILEYKEKNPEAKFLCVLDSLGALVIDKVMRDASKEKVTSDMGSRAKLVNTLMKAITVPALKSDTSIIVLNHVYSNPGAMFTSKIQDQGGGKGLQYMGSLVLQCTKLLEKDEDKDSSGAYYGGTHLKFFTVKNRIVRPSLETDIYLDFKKGFIRPFESLFDEAVRGGFILNPKQGYYTVPSWTDPDKLWRKSQIENNVEVWKTFLSEFDKWGQEDLAYKAVNQTLDSIETECVEAIESSDETDCAEEEYNPPDMI